MPKADTKSLMKNALGDISQQLVDSPFQRTTEPPSSRPLAKEPQLAKPRTGTKNRAEKTKTLPTSSQDHDGDLGANFERVTFKIRPGERDVVEDIARTIMRNGVPKKERITYQSVIRSLLGLLETGTLNINLQNISSEADLRHELIEAIKQQKTP